MGWWKKRKRNKKQTLKRGAELLEDLIECCDGKSNPIKFFFANEIRKATDNFSELNHVYELDNFCYQWYAGKNENHHNILIKKVAGSPDFYRQVNLCRDIAISSMVSGHKNFLKLVGCCLEFEDLVMVYQGVKKHYKLHDLREQPWKRRIKIAEDIATSLAYLHTAFPRPFVYRNLSLENILLDEDGVAKLRGFSFCVSIPKGETFVKVDRVMGSYAFAEEKYVSSGEVSEETDVFAIGMFMIRKLLTGEENFWKIIDELYASNRLSLFKDEVRMDEIADPEMGEISEKELCQNIL